MPSGVIDDIIVYSTLLILLTTPQDAMLVLTVFLISLRNLSSNMMYLQNFISITVVLLLNICVHCLSSVY